MAATLPRPDVFNKISDPSEKTTLLLDLAKSRGEIIAKKSDSSSDIYTMLATGFQDKSLSCKLVGASSPLAEKNGSMIVTYFIGGEKYFQVCPFKRVGEEIFLGDDNPIYHLQRRQDYRIRLAASYRILLEIVSVNGSTNKKTIPLIDLSGGGCRIQVNPEQVAFKVGDELMGHLFLPDRSPISVSCSVRHSRVDPQFSGKVTYGVQFIGMSKITKNNIIALVLDLYRQFFSGR